MKPSVPLAAKRLSARLPAIRRALMVLAPAVALACAPAAQAADYYVTWNATDATANIEAKILQAKNAGGSSRVILEYHSTPWYVNKPIVLDVPNMEFWIKGGTLMPKAGQLDGFKKNGSQLFKIRANNVTMNGYRNGVDTAAGRATLQMHKTAYADQSFYVGQGGRHCISIQGRDNAVIQGFYLVDSGGDGICVDIELDPNSLPNPGAPVIPYNHPYNTVIKQVQSIGSYRNGLSVISADKLTVTSCVFKESEKTPDGPDSPQAGVDIEPSRSTDILKQIKFALCYFKDNMGSNVEINPRELAGSGTVIDITFDGCTISGGGYAGMAFYSLVPEGEFDENGDPKPPGPTGTILVKNTTISGAEDYGLRFSGWGVDRVSTTMSNVDVINCNPTHGKSPIFWGLDTSGSNRIHGEVDFINGCQIIEDLPGGTRPNSAANTLVRAHNVPGVKDITGTIAVTRHPGSLGPKLNLGPNQTNCTLTVTGP